MPTSHEKLSALLKEIFQPDPARRFIHAEDFNREVREEARGEEEEIILCFE